MKKGEPFRVRKDKRLRKIAVKGLRKANVKRVQKQTSDFPDGITDVRSMTDAEVNEIIARLRPKLTPQALRGQALRWWKKFELENAHRPALVLRLVEELVLRSSTIHEFYECCSSSETENIQANLYYLDYKRLKTDGDGKKEPVEENGDKEERLDGLEQESVGDELNEIQNLLRELEESMESMRSAEGDGFGDEGDDEDGDEVDDEGEEDWDGEHGGDYEGDESDDD